MRRPAWLLLSVLSVPSFGLAQESVGSSNSPVVYGNDDRVDWYAYPNATIRELARNSIVAIVPTDAIDFSSTTSPYPPFADGFDTLEDYALSASGVPLCANERFATQPTVGGCSGTLIAPDLVLTAGHCFPDQAACDDVSIVFDYFYASDSMPEPIGTDDVYGCDRIVVRRETDSPHLDYAVIQLDRDAVGRVPAPVRHDSTALPLGTDLIVLGFGTGLPLKIDDGGEVTDPNGSALDTFAANTDTFAGNSGSGIFDDSGTLVGILVTGDVDYVDDGGCFSVNEVPSMPGNESSTYAFRALDALCASQPSAAPCVGFEPPPRRSKGRCSTATAGATEPPVVLVAIAAAITLALVASRRTRSRR